MLKLYDTSLSNFSLIYILVHLIIEMIITRFNCWRCSGEVLYTHNENVVN